MKKIRSIPSSASPRLRGKIVFIFLLQCFFVSTYAQTDSAFQYIRSVKGNFSYFNVDNLENLYIVTNTNQLKKINNTGDSVGVFNDVKRFGNPSSIDVTNPLKVLLYYKNFSTVITLDRLLSIRNTINFRKQNIFTVQCIAASYDNNIWLFDEQDYKLKKIDEDGNLLQESTDMRMLFDSVPSPVKVIDRENYVYLYDPEKGFYIFDYYGGFKNRYAFLNWNNVEVTSKYFYGFSDNYLYSYELNSFQLKAYKLPAFFGKYDAIRAMNGKLYLLNSDGIDIYQVK